MVPHGGARVSTLKPRGSLEGVLYALGTLACVALAVGSGALGEGAGLGLWIAAGALWLAGLDRWGQASGDAGEARTPVWAWLGVVAVAVALRGTAGLAPLELSDDVHRYVWEGELVRSGISPYAHAPDAPEHAGQRARLPQVYGRMNHVDISAAYPMGMQLASAAVLTGWDPEAPGAGDRAVRRMRWFFGLCDLAVLIPLGLILRRRRLPAGRALVWAACPLAAIEFAGSGHFDSLGILCLVGALAVLPAGRERGSGGRVVLGMALFAGAVWVKLLPVLLLPFVLRDGDWRRRSALFAVFSLALYAPLLWFSGGTEGLLRGLGAYGSRWEGGSLVYRWIASGAQALGAGAGLASAAGRLVALAALGLVGLGLWRRRAGPEAAALPLFGTFAVFTPMLHPWYLTWLAALLALCPRGSLVRPLGWLVAAAPLLYVPLSGYRQSGLWVEPVWTWALLLLPFGALLVWDGRRDTR